MGTRDEVAGGGRRRAGDRPRRETRRPRTGRVARGRVARSQGLRPLPIAASRALFATVVCTAVAFGTIGMSAAASTGGRSGASPSTKSTLPGTPTQVKAVAGNAGATVSWVAPGSQGGSAITGYLITPSSGSDVRVTDVSSAFVTGLRNGRSYTFTVAAINRTGTGPASASSNAVTPVATTPPTTTTTTTTTPRPRRPRRPPLHRPRRPRHRRPQPRHRRPPRPRRPPRHRPRRPC